MTSPSETSITDPPESRPADCQSVQSLSALIDSSADVATCLRIGVGIAGALRRLHASGLIHRNLKPANVRVNLRTGITELEGVVSTRSRSAQTAKSSDSIVGTFAYMAPEQTGRMNRPVDERTDLYSLGITLYQMLTGTLPFAASDPVEWSHCHIARRPPPPIARRPDLPEMVSIVVLKLLEKNPEDRYQTAAGLEMDLKRIAAEWEADERVERFLLGQRDVPSRLLIPSSLYGRQFALETLQEAFERVATSGSLEVVLVSGSSGVGKSSLVNELRKTTTARRALFTSGKFDQQKRHVPYASLGQAFQSLLVTLLGQSEGELQAWREKIRSAVGHNGQLVVGLVPALEWLIGPQPAVPSLPPREERNRFHRVLQAFIGAFARPAQPLILFIDDLQWLDAATLDLIEELITGGEARHLMVIGAFRGEAIATDHPLARILNAARGSEKPAREIALSPLSPADVTHLVSDTLRCSRMEVGTFAHLIYEKTRGNPFFTIQFIGALAEESLLKYDPTRAVWTWDLSSIRAKGYTDNVADLVMEKIHRLSSDAREILRQVACLGHGATTSTLAAINARPEEARLAALNEAVAAGLVFTVEDGYVFAHDRIQEAAYNSIPECDRPALHRLIAQRLRADALPSRRDELLFDIVNQLNRAEPLIAESDERLQAAELNARAGRQAKTATGFESALAFFAAAEAFLPADAWARCYPLAFGVACDRAECEFVAGHLDAANEQLEQLSARAANRVDLARVACLRASLHTSADRLEQAIETALAYLRLVGIDWSSRPTDRDVRAEYDRLLAQISGREIESLIDLPILVDPEWQAVVDVLLAFLPAARFYDSNLHALATVGMVNLSLQYGNCDGSCLAYATLSQVGGAHCLDDRAGYRFGQLGLDLVEQRGLVRFKARVYTVVGHHVWPRMRPLRDALALVHRACETARENGDFLFMAFSLAHVTAQRLALGDALADVQEEAERSLTLMRKARYRLLIDCMGQQLCLIWSLRGIAPEFTALGDEFTDELAYERHLESDPSVAAAACFYWIRKLQASFHAGDFASALKASAKAEALFWTGSTYVERAEYHFYDALAHAAAWDSSPLGARPAHREALMAHERKLANWRETAPENFSSRTLLVQAELARVDDRDGAAMTFYEKAAHAAQDHRLVNDEALVWELAGRFFLARGSKTAAHSHLARARQCYVRWGALGKVRQLDQQYPKLHRLSPSEANTAGNPSLDQMDLAVVLKASQAISSEIVLDRLIESLLRIAVEHAGADKGSLILVESSSWKIAARATTEAGRISVALRNERPAPGDLPGSVVHYALRTPSIVIVDDASAPNPYAEDEYIRTCRPKSLLCLPLFKQTVLVGALYLENSLATHVFTRDRVAVLELLASQAAISLENARLYSDLQEAQVRMAQAERLSLTGSWSCHLATGGISWSDETYRIWEVDRSITPTIEHLLARVHPDDLARFRLITIVRKHDEAESGYEIRLVLPAGKLKYVQIARQPIHGESGELIGFVGAIRDVTAQKKAEEAVQQARSELAHVARVATMGELTASFAHELNQPLAGIMTNGGACLRWLAAGNTDEARETIQRIIRDGRRASDVIARLRALFKRTVIAHERLDLNELIEEVIALACTEVQRHGAVLRTELAEDSVLAWGDRVQLQQVIFNLVLNAAEAMDGVEGRLRELVISTTNRNAEGVWVAVKDAGRGIDPENWDKIFDAFFTTKSSGMGMGLSISRSIIEGQGGKLWAQLNQDWGVTFFFTLPTHSRSDRRPTSEAVT